MPECRPDCMAGILAGWGCLRYGVFELAVIQASIEASYELTKIGNFPDAGHPKSWIEESPWFGRPLFGKIKRDSQHVDYEEDICFAYRNNGIGI